MDLTLPVLRRQANEFRKTSPRVTKRILALIELAKRIESVGFVRDLDYEKVAIEFGTSARTVFRWKKGYQEKGVKGVIPKASPGRRKSPIKGFTAKKIMEFRRKYNWGAEVIEAHLKRDFGIKISEGRIHRYLLGKGLIEQKKKRGPRPKHTRIVKVEEPGMHTQNDVKHLPHTLKNGQKCYVYNFADHASRWEFKRVYDSYGPMETRDFVDRVLKAAPFTIVRWQTDNGIEFTNKYISCIDSPKKHALDEICEEKGIRHVLIPVGEKELQGLVERSHRMDDNELYHRVRPHSIDEFNRFLEKYCEWKNNHRRRKALDWKAPMEWLEEHRQRTKNLGIVRPLESGEPEKRLPNKDLVARNGTEQVLDISGISFDAIPPRKNIELTSPPRPQIFPTKLELNKVDGTMPNQSSQEGSNMTNQITRRAA